MCEIMRCIYSRYGTGAAGINFIACRQRIDDTLIACRTTLIDKFYRDLTAAPGPVLVG